VGRGVCVLVGSFERDLVQQQEPLDGAASMLDGRAAVVAQ
jgi:hypothetical protein